MDHDGRIPIPLSGSEFVPLSMGALAITARAAAAVQYHGLPGGGVRRSESAFPHSSLAAAAAAAAAARLGAAGWRT